MSMKSIFGVIGNVVALAAGAFVTVHSGKSLVNKYRGSKNPVLEIKTVDSKSEKNS